MPRIRCIIAKRWRASYIGRVIATCPRDLASDGLAGRGIDLGPNGRVKLGGHGPLYPDLTPALVGQHVFLFLPLSILARRRVRMIALTLLADSW